MGLRAIRLLTGVCALVCALAQAAPNAGLVARYSFEDITGGRLRDLSGHGNDLTAQGTVTLVPGKVGQAVRISAAGYPQAPASPSLELGGAMTLEAWIRPEFHPASGMRLLDRATIGGNDGFMFDTWPEGHLRLIIAPGLLRDDTQLPVNEWTHVAATYSDELGEARLYRNGEVVAEATVAGKLRPSAHPLNLGASQGGGDRFTGLMDEVRIYNRALAPEEIMAHFQGKEIEPPLLARTILPPQPAMVRNGKPDVDIAALCARNDLVYLSPATYAFEAMHIGNGDLGITLWNEGGVTWQLNNGSFRHGNEPLSSGKLTLSGPALNPPFTRFEQRQHLWDGLVTTRLDGPESRAEVTSLVAEGEDCLVARVVGPAQEMTLKLHLWPSRALATFQSDTDSIALAEHVDNADPLLANDMALLVKISGADARATQVDARTLSLTFTPPPSGVTIFAANPVVRGEPGAALQQARAAITRLQARGLERVLADHAAFWHRFWPRSFVHFTSRQGEAEYLENLWYLYLYDMACMARNTLCPKFNGGNWLVHEDLRHWGGGYWHQNTREVVWPLYSANHADLSDPFFELYRRAMRFARDSGRVGLGVDGFYLPEWIPVNGGTGPLTAKKDFSKPGYTAFIFTVGLEVALQAWWRYEFTGDEQFLRDTVYPLLKGSLDFYVNYAQQGADGKWHLDPADAQESYWLVRDPAQDLAALRWALPLALKLSSRLGFDVAMRPRWQNLLDHLAPFAVDDEKHMLKEADLAPDAERHNSENVANYATYPFGIFGVGKPNLDLAINTFRNRPIQGMGNGWEPAAIVAARLGLADEAAKLALAHVAANQRLNNGGWYSPTTSVFVSGLPDVPYYDSAGVCGQALNEMLLQSHDGAIRLAPAWPAKWQAQFRLRARGGFMVTADVDQGQVRYALIESERGGRCRLVNPWPDKATVTCAGKPVAATPGREIAFTTVAGRSYLVQRAAAPLSKLTAARLAPPPATGPRALGKLPRYPQWNTPFLGLDAEGRSPQRATMLRNTRAAEDRRTAATKGLQVAGVLRPEAPTANGGTVTLDLGQPRALSAVVFARDRSGLFVDQAATGYVIEVLREGEQWQTVVDKPKTGAAPAGEAVSFPPVTARQLRLKVWGPYGGPVVTEELAAYGP